MTIATRQDRLPTVTAHMATYINVRRHELGLSLEEVAKRAGSSKAHIWALERQQSKNPTLWLILALCDALNCSLNSLIGADVSQPMFSEQEMALVDAHRRIFQSADADKTNANNPPPQTRERGDNQPRYTTKRLHDEIAKAKEYARREALSEAATKAHSLIAMDYVADSVRNQILSLPGSGPWLPIDQADKTITDVQDFPEVGMTIKTSDRYWVRDEDGRVYEAAWSEGRYGRDYWWDFEGESPVDPVEFMPHPLDLRWSATAPEGDQP